MSNSRRGTFCWDLFDSHRGARPGGDRPLRSRPPTRLRFTDGVELRTDGRLRVTRRADGYYVVGQGMSIPVATHAEGAEIIAEFQGGGQ